MKIKNDYIAISKKRDIANKVLMMCMDSTDGFIKIDTFKKELYTFVYAVEEYTGIKFDNDFEKIMEKYDKMAKSGDANVIFEMNDYNELCHVVDIVIDMVEKDNSVEHSVAQMCNAIISAFDKVSTTLANKIDEFDMESLQDIDITELMSVVQKLK